MEHEAANESGRSWCARRHRCSWFERFRNINAQRQPPWLVIEAQDTALHLPPDAVANMLDPFPRLENSPTRGYEGWEVGLPLVRRYVELHHGQLHLESLPEKGTIFYVTLPLKRQ